MIKELEKDFKKYKSKLVVITGDFFLSDQQILKRQILAISSNDTSN
ncbi:MAG TPA: hypothetical protein VK882_02715 [Nitrososphaeraceae archaeon]|nr:hypothetical protein [Nitrososphaeraceae archaeon]